MKEPLRRKARKAALTILYIHDLMGFPLDEVVKQVLEKIKLNEKNLEYLDKLISQIKEHKKKIDRTIKKYLINWDFQRLSYIDRAILRIATCELLYFEDIPPKVSIDEAIELAKEFSDDDARRFINGVLDAIYKNLDIKK
ncbi:MAG: transcription antitermination factor NusB [candidate division WOR-3 bacterium]|uniref:Transcription antitermination protein NusB n=1 Tax=candidate division WOR-3 bacterium TaxID=2052148 RepID=A0A7C4VZ09_UNCW3